MNGRAMNPTRIECIEENEERKKMSEKFTQILVPRSRGIAAHRYLVRQQSHMQLRN